MKLCLILSLVLLSTATFAQKAVAPDTSSSYVTYGPEPQYPGGLEAFYKFVQSELQSLDLDGTSSDPAWVKFVVNKNGEIIKVIILDSPDQGYENAILDLFKRMPKWTPAMKEGEIIVSEMTLPIFFD
jgi:protein TonB